MAILKIPQSVFDYGKPVPPGFYKAIVKSITMEPNSKKDGYNFVTIIQLEDEQYKGKEIKTWISSKLPLLAPELWFACTGQKLDGETEIDMDQCVGKKVQVKLVEETYNGNLQNKVDGFAEYSADTSIPFGY